MPTSDSLAQMAGVLADRSRAAMCLALMDGRAWTAGELARHAGVAPSTASAHLNALVAAGLLSERRQGRHRYVRLADDRTAQLLEDLAAVVAVADRPSSLRAVRASQQLAFARTCYDHLAGTLGVALFDALKDRALILDTDGLVLSPAGRTWFAGLCGAEVLQQTRRPLLRTCLDWTERRDHLGGALGSALCSRLLQRGWLARSDQHRGVTISAAGEQPLADLLGLHAEALRHPVP